MLLVKLSLQRTSPAIRPTSPTFAPTRRMSPPAFDVAEATTELTDEPAAEVIPAAPVDVARVDVAVPVA
jgi:hypothetical protein